MLPSLYYARKSFALLMQGIELDDFDPELSDDKHPFNLALIEAQRAVTADGRQPEGYFVRAAVLKKFGDQVMNDVIREINEGVQRYRQHVSNSSSMSHSPETFTSTRVGGHV